MKALYSILERDVQVVPFAAKQGFFLVLAIFFCSTIAAAQDPNVPARGWGSIKHAYQEGEAKGIPAGFPKFMDNGNPEADNADYAKRKKAWIEANPEAFRKMFDESPRPVHNISETEFKDMPDHKKKEILSKPDIYKIIPSELSGF